MSMIKIELDVDNAAFEDAGGDEVARILRELADRYAEEGFYIFEHLRDVNGNIVGSVTLDD